MARLARVVVPGVWHHATQRGNRRQTVFFTDSDRATYLQFLTRHCARSAVRIAGYCLMSNHVHLIAVPERLGALASALGRTHVDYARWLNLRRGETGHVWQNRFYSCALDERHQWHALRYVELNPVRAGLVAHAAEWPWSSAAAHLQGSDASGLLDLLDGDAPGIAPVGSRNWRPELTTQTCWHVCERRRAPGGRLGDRSSSLTWSPA